MAKNCARRAQSSREINRNKDAPVSTIYAKRGEQREGKKPPCEEIVLFILRMEEEGGRGRGLIQEGREVS